MTRIAYSLSYSYIGVISWRARWVATPRFWDAGIVESPLNIIMSKNVQEYEMIILSKSGDLSEIGRFAYNNIKIPGTIPSILCYVPSLPEFFGPATPRFKTWTQDTPCLQTRLTPLYSYTL